MKNVDIISRVVARKGETISSSSKGAQKNDFSDYLLKSIWEKVFEIRTDSQGTDYIFSKLPVVTQYGITMYSDDGVDIPSLASGLPFDGRTIWYNPDTNQIEVTGGGSGEGVSNFWDLSGIPSWITISKPKYTYSEIEGTPDLSVYATQNWIISQGYASAEELKKYIPISGYTEVSGEKNFTGGLKVNGSPIYYDTEKKYWKLEGDLLVTGGVTMYGSDSSFTPSTIMDAIAVDGTTISKSGGVLKVIGGTGGGVADSVAWANITGKPTWIGSSKPTYSYSEITGAISTTELQNYLTQNSYLNVTEGDNRYLKLSGGMIESSVFYGLRINSKDSSVNRSAITFLYDDSNKSQFGWDGYSGWGTFMYNYASSSYLGIKDNGTLVFNDNVLIHSGNYSQYALPLSGGTLTSSGNPLSIKRTDGNGPGLVFYSETTQLGSIGISTDYVPKFYNANAGLLYTIWHSGNDGAGSGLDADLLDGKQPSDLNVGSATQVMINYSYDQDVNYPLVFTSRDNIGASKNGGMYIDFYGRPTYNPKTDTLTVGNLSGNASSATKLQTARTIWGQSFDGTGNVSGHLTGASSLRFSGDIGIWQGNLWTSLNTDDIAYYATRHIFWGNVGIGTTSPQSKLEVEGIVKAKGFQSQSLSIECSKNGVNYSGYGWEINNYDNPLYIQSGSNASLFLCSGGGNVGIGTTNPAYKLDVNGHVFTNLHYFKTYNDASASAGYIGVLHNDNNNIGIISTTSSAIEFITTDYSVPRMIVMPNGNVGIGTTNPAYKLDVNGSARCEYSLFWDKDYNGNMGYVGRGSHLNNNLYIENYLNANIIFATHGEQVMYITPSYNVGIGTTNPIYKLDVLAKTNTTAYDLHYYNSSQKAALFVGYEQFWYGTSKINETSIFNINAGMVSDGSGGNSVFRILGNGNVGIGTENPTDKLHVAGDIRLKDSSNYGRTIYFGDSEFCYLKEASDDVLTIYASNGIKLNTSSTSYNVSINTNLLVSGGITMYSQRNLKNIQDDRGLSLGELRAIKPIRYTWKDNRDNRLHIGGIADDIQQVLPEVVYKTNNGVLTMDYGNAAFAIASSLINPVIDHEKRIAMLQERIVELEEEVERLKSA